MFETLIDFDRELLLAVNGSDSLFLDRMVRMLTNGLTWIPLYLSLFYMVMKNNDNFRKILFILGAAGLCVLLAGTVDDVIVKPTVARWRPTHDPEIGMLVDVVNDYRGGNYGFFSSHAANTIAVTTFFAIIVRSKRLFIALFSWYLLSVWSRLYLGQHFLTDIAVGTMWGIVSAIIACYVYVKVYAKVTEKKAFISEQYTTTGFALSDINIIVTVFLLTCIAAMICGPFMQ